MACPCDVNLAHVIDHNVIGNNLFTRRDVQITKEIFGPSIAAFKGKTVNPTSKTEREDKQYDISPIILKEYKEICLAIDVMHVNRIMFMLSCPKHIGLLKVQCRMKKNWKAFLCCTQKKRLHS